MRNMDLQRSPLGLTSSWHNLAVCQVAQCATWTARLTAKKNTMVKLSMAAAFSSTMAPHCPHTARHLQCPNSICVESPKRMHRSELTRAKRWTAFRAMMSHLLGACLDSAMHQTLAMAWCASQYTKACQHSGIFCPMPHCRSQAYMSSWAYRGLSSLDSLRPPQQ